MSSNGALLQCHWPQQSCCETASCLPLHCGLFALLIKCSPPSEFRCWSKIRKEFSFLFNQKRHLLVFWNGFSTLTLCLPLGGHIQDGAVTAAGKGLRKPCHSAVWGRHCLLIFLLHLHNTDQMVLRQNLQPALNASASSWTCHQWEGGRNGMEKKTMWLRQQGQK